MSESNYFQRKRTLRIRASKLQMMRNQILRRWYGLADWFDKSPRKRIETLLDRLEHQMRRHIASTHDWKFESWGRGKDISSMDLWRCQKCDDLSLRWPDPPETYNDCELTIDTYFDKLLDPEDQCHGCLHIYYDDRDRQEHIAEHQAEQEEEIEDE